MQLSTTAAIIPLFELSERKYCFTVRNHQKALAMAVASAGGAGLADLSFSALNIPSRLRDLLIAMDLLDGQEGE